MKEKYIIPTVSAITIGTTHMIAASSLGFGNPVNNAGGAESRYFDYDDEEEEYYEE